MISEILPSLFCNSNEAFLMRYFFMSSLAERLVRADYALSFADLKQIKLVTLPRPYPTFLPYYFETRQPQVFDIISVEALQLSIGPGISEDESQKMHGIAIERIRLE